MFLGSVVSNHSFSVWLADLGVIMVSDLLSSIVAPFGLGVCFLMFFFLSLVRRRGGGVISWRTLNQIKLWTLFE